MDALEKHTWTQMGENDKCQDYASHGILTRQFTHNGNLLTLPTYSKKDEEVKCYEVTKKDSSLLIYLMASL